MKSRELGATVEKNGTCSFRVWAPSRQRVDVKILGAPDRLVPMQRDDQGYWQTVVDGVGHGGRYFYRLDSRWKVAA